MLEAIADGWGISLTDERAAEIIERLTCELSDSEAVGRVLQRLSAEEREALDYVTTLGQVKAHVLARKYGDIRRLGAGRLEWEEAWQNPASTAERLWFLGLIYRAYGVDGPYHGEVFVIPAEIQSALPSTRVPLPVFRVEPASTPPVRREEYDALARDAYTLLSHLRSHDVRAKSGILATNELSKVSRRLTSGNRQRLQFLHHLCEQANLIRRTGGSWRPTSQAASWLKDGPLTRRRALLRTWLDDPNWNELRLMTAVSCEETGWRNDPVRARTGVLKYMAECPTDVWLSVDSLIASVRNVDPDFMRPDGDYDSWFVRDTQTGQYLMGFHNWGRVEGELIRYVLEYPLLWLGVLAVGCAREGGGVAAFLLNAQGATILGLRDVQPAEETPHEGPKRPAPPFRVLANFHVVAPLEASWYDRFLLERFARWVDEEGRVARYVIDAQSIKPALEAGIAVRQIQAFLNRATEGRVPARVMQAIESWGRQA